jgi:hypothetical protein
MSTQLLQQPARMFSLRSLGLILALVVAGGLASASQVKVAKASDAIELTYTKWFAPHYPLMTGVVGGDIVGSFGGYVISRTLSADGRFVLLEAQYEVHANNPSQSFTAIVEGRENVEKGAALLHGIVTSGWLTGEQVKAEFAVLPSCPGIHAGPCFQGTIVVMGSA